MHTNLDTHQRFESQPDPRPKASEDIQAMPDHKQSSANAKESTPQSGKNLQQIYQPPESILGHISIGVKDYDSAKAFYTAALRPLGLRLVYDSVESKGPDYKPRTLGYGPDETRELLNIFEYGAEAHAPGRGCHVAFNAPSRRAVDEFYGEAIRFGGEGDGGPGVRLRYGPDYYAAFVVSPDGWRMEAVCKVAA